MRRFLLATSFFAPLVSIAHAQSIGINTQLYMTPYSDIGTVEKALSYVPQITTLRDDLIGYNSDPAPYNTLAAKGYKFDMVVPSGNVDVASVVSQLHNFVVANPGALASIEGSNEVDNWPVTYNGQSGIAGAAAWQQALYAAVKADPVLKNIPVINATCGECNPSQFAQLSASGAFDVNSAHVYVQGGASATSYFAGQIPYEVPNASGKPVAVTETGYSGSGDLAGLLQASAAAGVQTTYLYELLPAGPDSFELGFGIFNPDGTPKQETVALEQSLANGAPVPTTASFTPSSSSLSSSLAASAAASSSAPNETIQSATITPGNGSITDAQGNVWKITASGSIMENGTYTPGGGGTSALTITNGIVYGQDNGHDGNTVNPGGWFTLSADGQTWGKSAPPGTISTALAASPAAQLASTIADYVGACKAGVPNSPASAGGFGTLNGQIYTPDGKPFLARGINLRSTELADIPAVLAAFPNLNFIRLNIRSLDSPASLQSAINDLTSRGIVVELEDHPDGGGGQGSISALEGPDVAWLGQVAAAFKNNPYVWYGTYNEPPTDGNLTAWQVAEYNAIRGAGATAPIMIEPGGPRPDTLTAPLNLSAYTSMTNIIADPHLYNFQTNFSTDPAVNAANVAAMIKSAQSIVSADGPVPVLIGEFGDSTDGSNTDPGGMQNVQAVLNNGIGFAAWSWISGGSDMLQSGGQLTAYGQAVASTIQSGGSASAVCAVSAVPPAITAPDMPSASTAPTAPTLAQAASDITAPALTANNLSVSQVAALAAAGP